MKRIMSFDGGGIRGLFSLQVAARVEECFRQHHGKPDLVLADVIDLFAGTSTGAIIASLLAWGAPVAEVEQLFLNHCREMFTPQPWWRRYATKYRTDSVSRVFREYLREDDGTPALLGSQKLRRLLLVVMRNATTGSPWPICSHPALTFNDSALPDCNLNIPLWQLVRASTAAPAYYAPEAIALGDQRFLFVDGAVSPFMNPSLMALLMTTLPAYRIGWPAGHDQIHLLSVGTGEYRPHFAKAGAEAIFLWDQMQFVIPALMGASSTQQDMLCRILGNCLYGDVLDSEVGALGEPSLLKPEEQKCSYVRYNCRLDRFPDPPWAGRELAPDNLAMIPRLRAVGQAYAQKHVEPRHLLLA